MGRAAAGSLDEGGVCREQDAGCGACAFVDDPDRGTAIVEQETALVDDDVGSLDPDAGDIDDLVIGGHRDRLTPTGESAKGPDIVEIGGGRGDEGRGNGFVLLSEN